MNQYDESYLSLIKNQVASFIHRAKWVMTDPGTILENACIETRNYRIEKIFPAGISATIWGQNSQNIIDHGDVLLMPFFINAHCHLELSALKNILPMGDGFSTWVQVLLRTRDSLGSEVLFQAAHMQANQMADHGTGFAADISTLGITRSLFENGTVSGIWFQEYLGHQTPDTDIWKNDLAWFSLAGHAPHTTSPELLHSMKKATRKAHLPFSIHLGESEEELKFLTGQPGKWEDFLDCRGIDTSSWPVGARSCVEYLSKLRLLDEYTLAVHLIHADATDINLLLDTGTRICLCPRSNLALHQRLADLPLMLEKGLAPALGTDSLASCASLDMRDEMVFVRKKFPEIPVSRIVEMATRNGAKALGIEHITGTLAPGKLAWFLKVPIQAACARQISERLVSYEW